MTATGSSNHGRLALLSLAALGVVYGDIGTSPLYALRESLNPAEHGLTLTEGNVLGVLSLIVWSLVLLVAVKYVTIVGDSFIDVLRWRRILVRYDTHPPLGPARDTESKVERIIDPGRRLS